MTDLRYGKNGSHSTSTYIALILLIEHRYIIQKLFSSECGVFLYNKNWPIRVSRELLEYGGVSLFWLLVAS